MGRTSFLKSLLNSFKKAVLVWFRIVNLLEIFEPTQTCSQNEIKKDQAHRAEINSEGAFGRRNLRLCGTDNCFHL